MRTVKYGESSIIATAYTELFGIQSYLVKGVRMQGKKGQTKSIFFQPAALLEMEVYHNELKNLQFIKDYQWETVYATLYFDVVKHAIAMYMIELLQHSMKQPEANPELFYLIETSLKQLDAADGSLAANLPLYFTLHLATELGFQLQGEFCPATPVLDLAEGQYVSEIPFHPHYLAGEDARLTAAINHISFYAELEQLKLSRGHRRRLLDAYQQFMALHIQDFGEMRSWKVLQEVLG